MKEKTKAEANILGFVTRSFIHPQRQATPPCHSPVKLLFLYRRRFPTAVFSLTRQQTAFSRVRIAFPKLGTVFQKVCSSRGSPQAPLSTCESPHAKDDRLRSLGENHNLNLHTELRQNEYGNELRRGLHTQIIINCA